MKKTICAICGTLNNSILLYPARLDSESLDAETFSARRQPKGRRVHYQLVRCSACGLVRSDPVFEGSQLEELYGRSKFTYRQETGNLKRTYGHYLKKAARYLNHRGGYLDIGCGNGFMLDVASKIGFEKVYGIEPSLDAVQQAPPYLRGNIKIGMFKPGLFDKNFFDLITIFQTLDHLEDPLGVLKECKEILKPGGVILAINHDIRALPNRILGARSPIVDIEHTYLYNKNTQKRLFLGAGFRVLDIFSVKNWFTLNYLISLLPLRKNIQDFLIGLAGKIGIGRLSIKIKPGNLGIIAKKNE